ncbi:sugar ABC transporter permease [Helcobacillus massiliensis]|uniref:Arabinogalactan oligomer/maltooligosaccharide transport system permease protein n=1 Tax=Helcobacillus massiliensis TaxID=521392 RepID=A0A839QZ84_9MICO|nr:sugar ABC transporter permease [Helcobacillus massiliensis]MBB3022707.1 arabinogalactan oligomer/maltooligosaccharide transport system permease protein [Helcobacillus massiliensis]MCT1558299.1 sugar ABC transporter permease [Helcobacillus massiliensis]MCT2037273.1 sugar ABC transporter permease [Helcobacillus massiliensis]MCT2332044.1 sugar ABC transporter permease [Helcobacillus massiliensis]MDK7742313.1 sugar ABC transporter permease [Helcobacillus massiliensis]
MSTSITTPTDDPAPRNRMSAGRWFREVGWRHLVGIAALVFAAIPILYVISASLNPLGTVSSTNLIPRAFSLDHFRELLSGSRGPFLRWYLNTAIVCGVVALTQVSLSVLASYAFSRLRFAGRRGGMLALLLIMMFPAILSMIAIYTMISDLGEAIPFLGLDSLPGYIVVLLGGSLGQVWLIKGFFDTIPRELDEAAIIDGATHWQTFTRILLPTLTPILATTFLLSLVGVMSDFLLGSIFLTSDENKTLAVGLYGMLAGDRSNNLGVFAAGAVLTMIPVIVLYQFLQKYIVGGSTSGAVKG